ncbi:MAG: transglycosylase domain-containing protein [Ancrocorticia sp.]|uniref:transglycosylase domain-containing protein n=1 Tax=Ancrocorticia sp. TaxID=2593684 RepID=UPI003F903969
MSSSRQQGATARQIMTQTFALLSAIVLGGALIAGIALPAVTAAGTAINAGTAVFEGVPEDLGYTEPSEQSVILASDGSVLARFYSENRIVVSSDQISQHMKDAAVSIEDRRFYEHNGVDVQGIVGALVSNLTGSSLSGGSSITQQYVRNALIEQGRISGDDAEIDEATEKSIGRKINEARYAISIEKTMSKDEILTGYLNLAQFGRSEYGVEAAAQRYFSKSAEDLSIAEAATLAGITQSPARWDPIKHPEDAQTRRNTVLGTMLTNGYIDQEEHDKAVDTPIEDTLKISDPQNGCGDAGTSAYFCEYVVQDVLQDDSWGADKDDRVSQLYRGGLTIQSTIDPKAQKAAYDSIVAEIPVGDGSGTKMALSSIEPGTGHIKAMAQNTKYGNGDIGSDTTTVNLNAGVSMKGGSGRQSGSTFKVFTLIEWLRQGHTAYESINSNSGTIPASSFTSSCAPEQLADYKFTNLEGKGGGQMTVLESTRQSVNGSFVHMASQLDMCNIGNIAQDLGVQRGDGEDWRYIPAQVLGANDIAPMSMANAAASLAADGKACKPLSFTSIKDAEGEDVVTKEPDCEQVLDQEIARETTSVLKNVVQNGATGESAQVPGREVAGKTGTSNNDYDAWFMGYTPQLATAIWHGHPEGQIPMIGSTINGRYYYEVYGGLFPAQVFSDYLPQALEGEAAESFTAPSRNVTKNPNPPKPQPKEESDGGGGSSSSDDDEDSDSGDSDDGGDSDNGGGSEDDDD